MQRDIVVKGRGLGGTSDLTLLAPIKPGFVESLESVTYKTRIKRVLETLHGARSATHEYAAARLLSDSVERVGAIHSVRVAVLEPENKVLLAVTFDGSWESYIRVLWDKVGSLLDLIFCGTEDYVTAYDHSFDEWLVWARRVQVETGFFYGPADSTARDVLYQRRIERMRERGVADEGSELRAVLPSAEEAVQRLVNLDPPEPDDSPVQRASQEKMVLERIRNGLQGLAGLYRLTDLHRPSTPDGDVLRRAALYLLLEFVQMSDDHLIENQLNEAYKRFPRQLDWLLPNRNTSKREINKRRVPPRPDGASTIDPAVRRDVQGGILRPYVGITHGLVLLLAFDDAAAFARFSGAVAGLITSDAEPHAATKGLVFRNLALTPAGLRAAGVDENTLELFPEEFRQGMAARAGLLGDVRNNHPRRWHLPRRFVDIDSAPGAEVIELDTVHAVYQLRCMAQNEAALDALELSDPAHPLRGEVSDLCAAHTDVRVLAVQPLRRRYAQRGSAPAIVEHFGYADGDGQPEVEPVPQPVDRNRVHLGEIINGHDNAADFAPDLTDPEVPEPVKERHRWLANGSFLVMRKYRQFVERLETAVAETDAQMASILGGQPGSYKELIYGKLMGRQRDGTPLAQQVPGPLNDFDYDEDRNGQRCPLHAHIRRAHQRLDPDKAMRLPRLMRRSVSYGPAGDAGDADRGLVFMAYNADLGEQFEVVQRWLTGGNSTGSSSGESCPIVGVPENGFPRYFRFEHDGRVFRVRLESDVPMFEAPRALTRLEWGLYLFTPSLSVLRRLHALATTAVGIAPAAAVPWQTQRGRRLIAALKQIEAHEGDAAAGAAWKAAIEDPDSTDRLDSASIWAAVREDHDGVLKTPYGVLVGNRALLSEVLLDANARYSICGQLDRMKRSIGEIYLGMDDGPVYRQQSTPINHAIGMLTSSPADRAYVFELAMDAANRKIDDIVRVAAKQAKSVGDARFEVSFDAREPVDEVLGDLCDDWFGLADSRHFRRGSADWKWQKGEPPIYPGHFTALSRYMFQPNPGPVAIELGERYGQALREAMTRFVADHRAAATTPKRADGSDAPIAAAIFGHATLGGDDDWVARTMTGVLMGFIAPIIGAVLNILRELERDGRYSALRAMLAGRTDQASAHGVLAGAMAAAAQMRPMPQIVWRTVLKPHRLGPVGPNAVDLAQDDKVVLALVSGTQQSLGDGQDDGRLMFGGRRSDPQHPTHACPGHLAGIESILGAVTALLARPEAMRHGVAPLTFVLEGDSGLLPSPAVPGVDRHVLFSIETSALQVRAAGLVPPVVLPKNRTGLVVAWGDSWLDFGLGPFQYVDLRDQLEQFGYQAPDDYCKWTKWPKAQTMSENTRDFCKFLRKHLRAQVKPNAVLLSAGGNDSTEDTLKALLNKRSATLPVFDPARLSAHIERLRGYYVIILDAIKKELTDPVYGRDIPVLVHGYDYPIPVQGGNAGWLRTPFWEQGYVDPNDPTNEDKVDVAVAAKAMRVLIDDFNDMLSKLHMTHPFVRHVRLTGTIETQWPLNTAGAWHNNLHPGAEAFALLALKVDAALQTPYP